MTAGMLPWARVQTRIDTQTELASLDDIIMIYDLAVLLNAMMNSSASEIVLVPYEEAYGAGFEDMPRRMPDISKIQRLIGYQPMLDLPEMLERVIAYERERGE